jgi:hypothetical protein
MKDLIYYIMFVSITHTIVNVLEMGQYRFGVAFQRVMLRFNTLWKTWRSTSTFQARVLQLQSNLPSSYQPTEEIGSEYCECLLMLSWGLLFASAFPIVSIVLTVAFLLRCRLLLHCMLVSRTRMLPHHLNTDSHWYIVFTIVVAAAVFTNASILAFVSKNIDIKSNKDLAFSSDLQASFSAISLHF